jgi:hypothetical protein
MAVKHIPRMDTPIHIYEQVAAQDECGYPVKTKRYLGKGGGGEPPVFPCAWTNAHGSAAFFSGVESDKIDARAVIRFHPGVGYGCIVEYKGKPYEITRLDDMRERRQFIELYLTRVEGRAAI